MKKGAVMILMFVLCLGFTTQTATAVTPKGEEMVSPGVFVGSDPVPPAPANDRLIKLNEELEALVKASNARSRDCAVAINKATGVIRSTNNTIEKFGEVVAATNKKVGEVNDRVYKHDKFARWAYSTLDNNIQAVSGQIQIVGIISGLTFGLTFIGILGIMFLLVLILKRLPATGAAKPAGGP